MTPRPAAPAATTQPQPPTGGHAADPSPVNRSRRWANRTEAAWPVAATFGVAGVCVAAFEATGDPLAVMVSSAVAALVALVVDHYFD